MPLIVAAYMGRFDMIASTLRMVFGGKKETTIDPKDGAAVAAAFRRRSKKKA